MFPSGLFSGLLTDLYELTMAAGYIQNRIDGRAAFELFVRHLPPHRNYLVTTGLEQALDFLENVHFSGDEVSYIRALPIFSHVRVPTSSTISRNSTSSAMFGLPPEGTISPHGRACPV